MAISNNQNDVTLMDESGNSIQYARIQMRRGLESQFDVSKMLPAEFAVTTDTEKVHVAFSPGKTKQLMTVDDALEEVQEKADEILATLPEDYTQLEEKVSSLSEDLVNLTDFVTDKVELYSDGYSPSTDLISKNLRWIQSKIIPKNSVVTKVAYTTTEICLGGIVVIEFFEKQNDDIIKLVKSITTTSTSANELVEVELFHVTNADTYISFLAKSARILSSSNDNVGCGYSKDTTSEKLSISSLTKMSIHIRSTVEYGKAKKADYEANPVLNGKNITLIGDSITEYNIKAKTNWPMYLANWSGSIIQNLGKSGTGFVKKKPYKLKISEINKDVDIIGVAISFNDMSAELDLGTVDDIYPNNNTLAGYANEFFDLLINAFPTTPIVCYVQSPWSNYYPGTKISDDWVSLMNDICKKNGIPCDTSMYYGSVLKPWREDNRQVYYKADNNDVDDPEGLYGKTDGTHPNSEGHKVVARRLEHLFVENIVDDKADYISN